VPAGSALTLAGGTFNVGGHQQTLRLLALIASSAIDFGRSRGALIFADSHAISWTGTLTIHGFTTGATTRRFGNDATALTSTQLSDFRLAGDGNVAGQIDASGFVTPAIASAIPEPATYAALFGAGALVFAAWRRRRV
jgi:hypothetical protein